MSAGAPTGASGIIKPVTRRVFYSPSAGRAFLTRRAAFNAEAKARFFAHCDCEPPEDRYDRGHCCDLHDPDGKYKQRREDGSTLTGRIIRRWSRLLEAKDRAERRQAARVASPDEGEAQS